MSTNIGAFVESRNASTSKVNEELKQDDGMPDYLRMILTSRVYDVCEETPCDLAVGLSAAYGARIYLKREDLQPVFSFKLRGAYNMMAQMSEEERKKGVISTSAGNHAQGVAYSAKRLNMPATIVMPTGTPAIKYGNVHRLGAKVVLYGENFDEAKAECNRLQAEQGLTYIPPFDDPYVIAGQGTIGLEVLRQIDTGKLKAIVCGIGGGGLIAGIGAYIKRIAPHVKLIGVETNDADAMYRSIRAKELVMLKEVGLFADGTAVKVPGSETFRLASKYVDEIVHVDTDEICAAIEDVFNETRSVMEPSGAMSVAGLKKYLATHPNEEDASNAFCAVLSGANMNFDRLRFVSERSRLGAGKEVFLIVEMQEKPGSFRRLTELLMPRQITEFSYRYRCSGSAQVYISFTVKDRKEIPELIEKMEALHMTVHDVSDNDLAKSHARYMVGGTPNLPNERVFKFQFPERPGALQRFLRSLELTSNITMFHYRDYGSDIASVLAGIQVPKGEEKDIDDFLQRLGFPYSEETDNIAYKLFLK